MQAATASSLKPPGAGVAVNGSSSTASASNLPSAPVPEVNTEDALSDEDDDDQWENNSIYEDMLSQADEAYRYQPGPDMCTPQESEMLRRRLRQVGIQAFVRETIGSGDFTARKLCSVFRLRIPSFLQDEPDEALYELLSLAMLREHSKRLRLPQYRTIDDAAKLLQSSKNIMVITGAGISTSLGIPDFRSKDTGFYTKLQALGIDEPEEVFDLSTFDVDPTMFYKLASDILPMPNKWTPTHQFIRVLQDQDKLLRNYTQNIDNIESVAGIKSSKVIQCHGSFATATCRKCGFHIPGDQIFDSIRQKKVAYCTRCKLHLQAPGLKRKRSNNGQPKPKKRGNDSDSDSDGQYDIPEPGVMKPDITFFGEKLPDKFFNALQNEDRHKVDLVIVIGTSMKVAPVSEIPQYVEKDIPQIYISRDPIPHIDFDINLLGDCDTIVTALCQRAGWAFEHEMIDRNATFTITHHPDHEYAFTVKSNAAPSAATAATVAGASAV